MKENLDARRWERAGAWLYVLALSVLGWVLSSASGWAEGPPPPPSPPAVPIGHQEVAAIGAVAFLLYMLRGKKKR